MRFAIAESPFRRMDGRQSEQQKASSGMNLRCLGIRRRVVASFEEPVKKFRRLRYMICSGRDRVD